LYSNNPDHNAIKRFFSMNLSDAKVMLCNCDGTMTLDGTKLAKACGAEGGCKIATSLCRTETGDLAAADARRP
jgi:hypothetical protein